MECAGALTVERVWVERVWADLRVIIEAESMLNDGTAIVAFEASNLNSHKHKHTRCTHTHHARLPPQHTRINNTSRHPWGFLFALWVLVFALGVKET